MKLLHLDSSILGDNSVSRELSAAAVERFRALHPDLEIARRDLVADPIPHLTGAYLAAQSSDATPDPAMRDDLAHGSAVLDEFFAADIVVVGAALYNFTVPSQLKTWIDRILIAGKTFRYTENGPEGLAGDRRVVLTIARGGSYGAGSPMEDSEHTERYLRSVFRFIGVTSPDVIIAEGVASGGDRRAEAIETALAEIAALT